MHSKILPTQHNPGVAQKQQLHGRKEASRQLNNRARVSCAFFILLRKSLSTNTCGCKKRCSWVSGAQPRVLPGRCVVHCESVPRQRQRQTHPRTDPAVWPPERVVQNVAGAGQVGHSLLHKQLAALQLGSARREMLGGNLTLNVKGIMAYRSLSQQDIDHVLLRRRQCLRQLWSELGIMACSSQQKRIHRPHGVEAVLRAAVGAIGPALQHRPENSLAAACTAPLLSTSGARKKKEIVWAKNNDVFRSAKTASPFAPATAARARRSGRRDAVHPQGAGTQSPPPPFPPVSGALGSSVRKRGDRRKSKVCPDRSPV